MGALAFCLIIDKLLLFSLLTNVHLCAKIILYADVAQWQSARFPSQTRGFDSRHLLQSKKFPHSGDFLLYTG